MEILHRITYSSRNIRMTNETKSEYDQIALPTLPAGRWPGNDYSAIMQTALGRLSVCMCRGMHCR